MPCEYSLQNASQNLCPVVTDSRERQIRSGFSSDSPIAAKTMNKYCVSCIVVHGALAYTESQMRLLKAHPRNGLPPRLAPSTLTKASWRILRMFEGDRPCQGPAERMLSVSACCQGQWSLYSRIHVLPHVCNPTFVNAIASMSLGVRLASFRASFTSATTFC